MSGPRHDWTEGEARALFALPFSELLYQAQTAHRRYFDPGRMQLSKLLSIKTGGCPEDCAYCPQSAHFDTGIEAGGLMALDDVLAAARAAKAEGASRFCMGAAWRGPRDGDMDALSAMVEGVGELGLETCVTLGMLSPAQARKLDAAGLDYYNHNLDTSEGYYGEIITTRTYQDRLDTLAAVRETGIKVCSGGIVGMGETVEDRATLLRSLATLDPHPETVPINMLIPIPGTPLAASEAIEPLDFVRVIAAAKVMMPASVIRLSAGREGMSAETQALCFLAGASSIFIGSKLLTASNPGTDADRALLGELGLDPRQ